MCEDNIVDYVSQRYKYVHKGKGKGFQEGIRHIDEFIQNPVVRI